MKKILAIGLIFLIVFLIYNFNKDKEIYYFNIMDKENNYPNLIKKEIPKLEKYINYQKTDLRVTDLIRDINDNIVINNKNIQNILIKADLITLSIGNNEIEYKIKNTKVTDLYNYVDEVASDIEELLKLIRIYSKEKIYLIGINIDNEYYKELIDYLNIKLEDICDSYNVEFIKNDVNIVKKVLKTYCKC